MFRQNLQHTARSANNGPTQPITQWSYSSSTFDGSAPAIGSDGTIYAGLGTNLYAFATDGSTRWSYAAEGNVKSPLIASDGTIYFGTSAGRLYAINPNGSLKWFYQTGSWIQASPTIDQDGTVYIGSSDEYFYAINSNGTLKWRYHVGSWINSSATIDGGGVIYFGSTTSRVYALNFDGTLRWQFPTENYIDSSPAIAPDGTIYIGSLDNKLYALTPNGSLRWSYTTGGGIGSSPAIASDGTIYVGSGDNRLYAFSPDGSVKWSYIADGQFSSSPAIGSDGIIYISADDSYLYALSPTGSLVWRHSIGNGSYGAVIGTDSRIYINSYGMLYAIGQQSVLATPTNLTATAASQTQINLSWTDNSSDETNFRVERSPNGTSGWTEIATVAANTTTYNDTGLTCGTPYYYRVRVWSSDTSYSGYSNNSNTTTQACTLAAPSNLTAIAVLRKLRSTYPGRTTRAMRRTSG